MAGESDIESGETGAEWAVIERGVVARTFGVIVSDVGVRRGG